MQTLDNLAINEMLIDDFVDIRLIVVLVPNALRINNHDRALSAAIKTAGSIYADFFQLQRFNTLLGIVAKSLGIMLHTVCFALGFVALIGTKKYVMFVKVSHAGSLPVDLCSPQKPAL
ncbi:MAG: hypothetical protein R3341_10890 [Methylophaga sp.]|nr:hypothetical protein [Methylophaga sp.]